MKPISLALSLLVLAALACNLGVPSAPSASSDSSAAPSAPSAPSDSSVSPSAATSAAPSAVDPRLLDTAGMEECGLVTDSDFSALLGQAPADKVPEAEINKTACYYNFSGGQTVYVTVITDLPGQQIYDSRMQYLDSSAGAETLPLGQIAILQERDGQISIQGVVNGWYLEVQGRGFDRQAVIALARLFETRLIPYPQQAAAATSTVPGALLDMKVVIESPAEMAGTTTLESLKMVSIAGFAMCSQPGPGPFVLSFNAPPATDPPTPVGIFSITTDGPVQAGATFPAQISVGVGQSDVAPINTWQGTITLSADGTAGTFEVPGGVKGSWACVFSQ